MPSFSYYRCSRIGIAMYCCRALNKTFISLLMMVVMMMMITIAHNNYCGKDCHFGVVVAVVVVFC